LPSPKFRLSLFGPFELAGPDGPIDLAGGKTAALLAFLVYTAPRPQTREKLMALLWGSHFEAQARQNLRQGLVSLRRALGRDAVTNAGDAIALQQSIFTSDVMRFQSLMGQESRASLVEAVDLYRGEFLSDIAVAEQAWTDWLRVERRKLEGQALASMMRLAEEELVLDQADRALAISQRAIEINNLREDAHRVVIRALAARGRRADALKQYDHLVALLKRELNTEPDSATREIADDLRRPRSIQANPPSPQKPDIEKATPLPAHRPSIAVLPFTNLSGDPDQEYFSDGITEDIITELSRFSELFIIARNSSFRYKGMSVDVRQVGHELGVRYVLEGSIRRAGDRVRITGQLIDAITGAHRWAERYDRELKDVFAVQDELARTIVAILVAHVNKAEIERSLMKPPAIWHAYDYYMRATDAYSRYMSSFKTEDVYEVRRLLEHSLSIDPSYARAHAMLSRTHLTAWLNPIDGDYLNPSALDRAYQSGRKAVQLDAKLPDGHVHLGTALTWMRRFEVAVDEFERAIALNPNLSDWHFAVALIFAGEAARAIEVARTHMRLDPFYPPLAAGWLGFAYYMLRQYSEALPLLRECVSRAPDLHSGHAWLAATYAQLGRVEEARAEAAEVLRIAPQWRIDGPQSRCHMFKNSMDAEHYSDGLRRAGLPAR
jgi:TolB-like protein/DNA-binding SARP family transcriptional activator